MDIKLFIMQNILPELSWTEHEQNKAASAWTHSALQVKHRRLPLRTALIVLPVKQQSNHGSD